MKNSQFILLLVFYISGVIVLTLLNTLYGFNISNMFLINVLIIFCLIVIILFILMIYLLMNKVFDNSNNN